jgi:hypothetical protein
VVTASDVVHHHGVGGALSVAVRCHRHFSVGSEGSRHDHRLGTSVPKVTHCPIFPEDKGFAG